MSKEDGYSPGPETKKKLNPIERERIIVLALGDPGEVGEDGQRRKKTHRQIAEEVFDYELSELPPQEREKRLEYRIITVRATGRNFIQSVSTFIELRLAQRERIKDLYKEVKLQNKDRNLDDPNSLFNLFGIHKTDAQKRSTYGTHHIPTLESLRFVLQPEEPTIRKWNFDEFMNNLRQANEESRERIRREKDHSTHNS